MVELTVIHGCCRIQTCQTLKSANPHKTHPYHQSIRMGRLYQSLSAHWTFKRRQWSIWQPWTGAITMSSFNLCDNNCPLDNYVVGINCWNEMFGRSGTGSIKPFQPLLASKLNFISFLTCESKCIVITFRRIFYVKKRLEEKLCVYLSWFVLRNKWDCFRSVL